jgi:hypothetical protein
LLNNDEAVPGMVTISYHSTRQYDTAFEPLVLQPIGVDGHSSHRIAMQSEFPPRYILIDPALSMNRRAFEIKLPNPSSTSATSTLLPFLTKIEYSRKDTDYIIIDDLDGGFSIQEEYNDEARLPWIFDYYIKRFISEFEPEMDQGLPLQSGYSLASLQGTWMRREDPSSFGRYRHTYALKLGKLVDSQAKFCAVLPFEGNWQVEFYLPRSVFEVGFRDFMQQVFLISNTDAIQNESNHREAVDLDGIDGKVKPDDAKPGKGGEQLWRYQISVQYDNKIEIIDLDIESASEGWNRIGKFGIHSQEVCVLVDAASPGVVVADAIRLSPLYTAE